MSAYRWKLVHLSVQADMLASHLYNRYMVLRFDKSLNLVQLARFACILSKAYNRANRRALALDLFDLSDTSFKSCQVAFPLTYTLIGGPSFNNMNDGSSLSGNVLSVGLST